MKFDSKTTGIIISALLTIGTGLYHLIDAKNKAEVELILRKENDKTLDSYAMDLSDCK